MYGGQEILGTFYDFMRFNQLVRTDSLFQFVDPS